MVYKQNDRLVIKIPQLSLGQRVYRLIDIVKQKKKLFIISAIIFALIASVSAYRKNMARQALNKATHSVYSSYGVNKNFNFPGLDNKGNKKGKLKMVVTNTELTDEVVVRDKTFRARNNKMFLLVNIELTNDSTIPLNIFPGDLIRLTYNGNEEKKYSPDLHNNLVLVSPISTRPDRVGFVIPAKAKDFNLQVGELEGKKEVIKLQFGS